MAEKAEADLAKVELPVDDPEDPRSPDEQLDEKRGKDRARQLDLLHKKRDDSKLDDDEDITEEDRKLKEKLELLVERVLEQTGAKDEDALRKTALEALQSEIKSATSSMTAVPKPLKFLKPHYVSMVKGYNRHPLTDTKRVYADVMSIMAMTMGKPGKREMLKFRLAGTEGSLTTWGHEYVRSLAGEIGDEYNARQEKNENCDELMALVHIILPFNITHNADTEAIDLLLEVDHMELMAQYINKDNYRRICQYIIAAADYMPDPDQNKQMLTMSYDAYLEHGELVDALRVAIKMDDKEMQLKVINSVEEGSPMQAQLGFVAASNRLFFEELEDNDDLMEIIGNVKLNGYFMNLAKELDVLDPKTPEDIYKSHLEEKRNRPGQHTNGSTVDSAKQNLAATFVNAFVNCGFGKDTLLTPEGSDWLYKNKSHGMLSAAGSLGMIMLWDLDNGFDAADKYSYSRENMIKSGALLASGILSSGVTSDIDATLGLLSEHLESDVKEMKLSAVYGLGLAYAGSYKEDVLELLVPLIVDDSQPMDIVALTCMSLGLVFCGSGNMDITGSIIEAFMDRSETDLKDSTARLMCLGLALLFMGRGEDCELALTAIKVIENPIVKYLEVTVQTCAYVGSCSVLEIQKLLSMLTDHIKEADEDPAKGMHQEVAVLGIAMIAMGEPLGQEMALRQLDHVLQYGEVNVRRVVPLALGLLSISNPRLTVMDTLSKLSHDQDEKVSQNAVLSLGLLGAGTNNSRIAGLLRQLAAYYSKEPNHLFLVRIAQGLLHLGKGLMTLNPHHSDGLIMSKVGVAGLLVLMHSALDLKNTILNERHYLLFSLVCSIRPRMLVTLDEELEPKPVGVRVGQAVDTVAQAGKPKSITGFQTHTTPVIIAHGERAVLADEEFVSLSSVLEGFVVVRPNPDSEA